MLPARVYHLLETIGVCTLQFARYLALERTTPHLATCAAQRTIR